MNEHKEKNTKDNAVLDTSDTRSSPESEQVTASGMVVHQEFSGPLPPPSVLIQYNRAHPDAANRIITMAEQQQTHRHKLEAQVVASGNYRGALGLWLGAFITLTALVMAGVLILQDKTAEGLTTVILSLGSLIGAFIYANERKARELKAKREDM
jgi:uncharacterized membrane protein